MSDYTREFQENYGLIAKVHFTTSQNQETGKWEVFRHTDIPGEEIVRIGEDQSEDFTQRFVRWANGGKFND